MPPVSDDGNGVETDDTNNDDPNRLSGLDVSRRRVLQFVGGAAAVGALGITGWAGRAAYLSSNLDRTQLGGEPLVRSQASGPGSDFVPSKALLAKLDTHSEQRENVGLQAAILFEDGTTWRGVAGNADHDEGVPLSFDSHLYVGSVTKLFTASLTLRHVDRGVVSLTDTVDEWVDLPYADEVTLRMLLNHTSGAPSYTEDAWFITRYFGRPSKYWQPEELVDAVREKPPKFDPGSRHEYSNTNYALLGLILERVTSTSYRDLLGSLVREELGYERTYYLDYSDDTPIANGYDESIFRLGRRNLTGFRTSLESGGYAAGGVLSTAPDTAGFLRALFDGRIIKDRTLAEMRTFVEAPDDDVPAQRGYGLGLRQLRVNGEELVGHTGTIPGYSAVALHHDEPRYTMAVLSNVSTIDQTAIVQALQTVVLQDYY